ncbi:hypothetical protein RQP46_007420 [Phenoliferia psychrophenolica]
MISTAEATAQALAALTALIESIPAGVNPYPYIRAKLSTTSLPLSTRTRYRAQLEVLSALLGLWVFCLLVRCARKTLWLFRLDRLRGASLIVPHYTNTFAFFSFLSYVSFTSSSKRSARWYNSAWILNAYGVGLPLALCLGATVPAAVSTKHYLKAADASNTINALLASAEETYNGTISVELIQKGAEVEGIVLAQAPRAFKATYAVYAAIGLVILVTLLVSSFLHMTALREAMRKIVPDTQYPPNQQQLSILGRLQDQYRTLRLVLGLFSVTIVLFEAITFFTMADTKHIIRDGPANQAANLFPRKVYLTPLSHLCQLKREVIVYTYTVFGLPISLILLRNSFNRERPVKPHEGSNLSLVEHGTGKKPSLEEVQASAKAGSDASGSYVTYQSYPPSSH